MVLLQLLLHYSMSVGTLNGNMLNNNLCTRAEYHLPSFLKVGDNGGSWEEFLRAVLH